MNATEAVIQAIDHGNVRAARWFVESMRARGKTYAQVLAYVRTLRPLVTEAEWDGLMYEADEMDSQEEA